MSQLHDARHTCIDFYAIDFSKSVYIYIFFWVIICVVKFWIDGDDSQPKENDGDDCDIVCSSWCFMYIPFISLLNFLLQGTWSLHLVSSFLFFNERWKFVANYSELLN